MVAEFEAKLESVKTQIPEGSVVELVHFSPPEAEAFSRQLPSTQSALDVWLRLVTFLQENRAVAQITQITLGQDLLFLNYDPLPKPETPIRIGGIFKNLCVHMRQNVWNAAGYTDVTIVEELTFTMPQFIALGLLEA